MRNSDPLSVTVAEFCRDQQGAAIVEYGVAIALILAIVLSTLLGIGDNLAALFGGVESDLGREAPN